jgi:hypothetical protein
LGRMRKRHAIGREASLEQRKAILAALARVTGEQPTASTMPDPDNGDTKDYYTLTAEEMGALVSGDMEKIENWVSNLDQRHATWLLRWLIKEGP